MQFFKLVQRLRFVFLFFSTKHFLSCFGKKGEGSLWTVSASLTPFSMILKFRSSSNLVEYAYPESFSQGLGLCNGKQQR